MSKKQIFALIFGVFLASIVGRLGARLIDRHVISISGEAQGQTYRAICLVSLPIATEEQP